jgi:hypothetical protein
VEFTSELLVSPLNPHSVRLKCEIPIGVEECVSV